MTTWQNQIEEQTGRNYKGVRYDRNNIFAPLPGEEEEYEKRMNESHSRESDPYEEGYRRGYKDSEDGRSKRY